MRPLAVCCVMLLLLAGCAGAGPTAPAGTDGATAGDERTGEPAGSSNTATEAAAATASPAGVDADGRADGVALLAAHEAALENRSYRRQVRLRTANDSVVELLVVTGDRLVHREGTGAVYVEGATVWERSPGGSVSEPVESDAYAAAVRERETTPGLLGAVLEDVAFRRTGSAVVDGTDVAVLTAGPEAMTGRAVPESLTPVSARALVDGEGVVRLVELRYRTAEGEPYAVDIVHDRLGAAHVDRPAWVEEE